MEQWRAVVGHEGRYEVSDHGRVRSLDRYVTFLKKEKLCTVWYAGKLLKPATLVGSGHVMVWLGGGKRKPVCRKVHHLVLEAFVGLRPSKNHYCRHKNDVPYDNSLSNLSWDFWRPNILDRKYNKGASNWKLTPDNVREARKMLTRGDTLTSVARFFNVTPATMHALKTGFTHSDVV